MIKSVWDVYINSLNMTLNWYPVIAKFQSILNNTHSLRIVSQDCFQRLFFEGGLESAKQALTSEMQA